MTQVTQMAPRPGPMASIKEPQAVDPPAAAAIGSSRRLRRFVLLLALAILPGVAHGQTLDSLMKAANEAESAKQYARAARLFEQVYGVIGRDPAALYFAASSAAEAGDNDLAFRDLRRALAEDLTHLDHLAADSAFTNLHGDARWLPLIADIRRRRAGYNLALRDTLLQLAQQDQANRQGLDSVMNRFGRNSPEGDSAAHALPAADSAGQAQIKAIIARHGWPSRRLVGDDGARAVWLVVQHMPAEDQRRFLPLLQAVIRSGGARASDGALLEDRVLVADKKPQRYGSQMSWSESGGAPVMDPIENEACVDRRRAMVGLEPLRDYLHRFGVDYKGPPGRCE